MASRCRADSLVTAGAMKGLASQGLVDRFLHEWFGLGGRLRHDHSLPAFNLGLLPQTGLVADIDACFRIGWLQYRRAGGLQAVCSPPGSLVGARAESGLSCTLARSIHAVPCPPQIERICMYRA